MCLMGGKLASQEACHGETVLVDKQKIDRAKVAQPVIRSLPDVGEKECSLVGSRWIRRAQLQM